MGVGRNYVTSHALRRIRERWPAASGSTQTKILNKISRAIELAEANDELIQVPGGTYVPFSYGKDRGFLVLKKRSVITAVRDQWCPEVTAFLEKKRNGQVRAEPCGVPSDAT